MKPRRHGFEHRQAHFALRARARRPVQRTGAGTTNPGWAWVRLPDGVLEAERGEAWLSRQVGDLEIVGSNPTVLTGEELWDVG